MTENDAEEIIELTEIVEEPGGVAEDPDEEAIRKAFEEDDFFSKIEEADVSSDQAEGEGSGEESPAGDDDFLDELLDGGEGDQEAGPDSGDRSDEEPSEDVVDIEDMPEPESGGLETAEAGIPDDLETSFELEESLEEASEEEPGAEAIDREDADDEFGELEDFKIDVSIPESGPEDLKESEGIQSAGRSGTFPLSRGEGETPSTGRASAEKLMGTVEPEKVEAILERVAREVLGETAERIFSEVAERVIKEEIERIKAEINRLSNRD
ncbi:MAG: hypothetical protein HY788_01870 [Deltaproteobacteria bacterium]|nr:hypothetical protein [Deltaproteobacteria bacterium]